MQSLKRCFFLFIKDQLTYSQHMWLFIYEYICVTIYVTIYMWIYIILYWINWIYAKMHLAVHFAFAVILEVMMYQPGICSSLVMLNIFSYKFHNYFPKSSFFLFVVLMTFLFMNFNFNKSLCKIRYNYKYYNYELTHN